MTDSISVLIVVVRFLVYATGMLGIVVTFRWLRARSEMVAALFATGVVIRTAAGLALFSISNFQFPVLTELQAGGGFWTLAIDARSYYDQASQAVIHGI